jgi:starch synthase
MKILYITLENLSLHKGSVVHIREIVAGLQKLGHHLGLVGSSQNKSEEVDNFYNLWQTPFFPLKFFSLKRQPYLISSIFLFFYLFKILPRYDIIYARDYHTAIIAFLPRVLFNKKLIFEMNGLASEERRLRGKSIVNRIFAHLVQKAEKMAAKYSDRIVVVTPEIASYLETHFYCQAGKVEVVGNGVNTGKFYPIDNKGLLAEWRRKLGIGKDEIVIAFVGNLAPWQGVESLIRVAPVVLAEMRNLRFLIIGDGILKKELEGEVVKLGIEGHFIFTGMIDYRQIPLYINISDVCVVLKQELASGYSAIKLYEYMACGKPVIASRVAGLEFIGSERAGTLTEPANLNDLKEALFELVTDPEKRADMGQKGLKIAQERFSWDLQTSKIEKILKELA